jgi:hypothetical protein
MSEIAKQEPDPRHRAGGGRGGDESDAGGSTPNAGGHQARGDEPDEPAGAPADPRRKDYGRDGDGSDGGGGTPNSGGPPRGD